MIQHLAKFLLGVVLIFVLSSSPLHSQDSTATLTGSVTDSAGKALPNVKISVKNLATGESIGAQTDSTGRYSLSNLAAGDYEVSVETNGAAASTQKVTLAAPPTTLNFTLSHEEQNLPNAPSPSKTAPSLEDLGFSASESQADAKRQALLDKRTHMLKIHQRMGLITTIPMIASVVTSFNAGGRNEGSATRDLHVALGALTGDLYGITAYYAIRAPRIPGTETKGPIKVHKILAWIHGPGMIATPILGAIAYQQKNNGEKVHGVAQAHGPGAIVTAGAFGAALLSVSMKF
jgi:Carboxypeptidase regulatory-like domain